jgi:hypothetical protein
LKNRLALFFLLTACFLPASWRVLMNGFNAPIALLSDLTIGLLVYGISLASPSWFRLPVLVFWTATQVLTYELINAMQRLPTWQDAHYLLDPDFVRNSTAGWNFSSPLRTIFLAVATLGACVIPPKRPRPVRLLQGLLALLTLFVLHGVVNNQHADQSVLDRYNGLHWFVVDGINSLKHQQTGTLTSLPSGLTTFDGSGDPLLPPQGKARNVLIVILEGIPGMYYPEIGTFFNTRSPTIAMERLAASTQEAMLVPDFTAHSHQTVRGLYSILCGDFSKLSWDTPKAFELLSNRERAQQCLPAVLNKSGWSTHFLQAANLGFMGKDRIMPAMGFSQVHGNEWFTRPNPFPFHWGVVDEVFFDGATQYIKSLRAQADPWMLTLLTVGTHQPYAVPDGLAARYPSRKEATVDLLDQAVGNFIDELRREGVLKDTLVIITSDESHGSPLADWISSWGLALVLAPEQSALPRIKEGGYGLVDITPSVLDYLGLPMPGSVIGRSLFRHYANPREMVAYTVSKRRWHTADNFRYECSDDGYCRAGTAFSLLGPPPDQFAPDKGKKGSQLEHIARMLDQSVISDQEIKVLQFANGEQRPLPETITNEWADNLVGAQYLDFPANTQVQVSIRYTVTKAEPPGVQLTLLVKQWEYTQTDLPLPVFPVVAAGQEKQVVFSFDNPQARKYFSFHLLGTGKNAAIRLDEFKLTIKPLADRPKTTS